jgi:hypothetical protein
MCWGGFGCATGRSGTRLAPLRRAVAPLGCACQLLFDFSGGLRSRGRYSCSPCCPAAWDVPGRWVCQLLFDFSGGQLLFDFGNGLGSRTAALRRLVKESVSAVS